jgi:hypothetical protein
MRKPRPGHDQKSRGADGPSVPEPFAGILGTSSPSQLGGYGEYQRQPSNSLLLGIEIAKYSPIFRRLIHLTQCPLFSSPALTDLLLDLRQVLPSLLARLD